MPSGRFWSSTDTSAAACLRAADARGIGVERRPARLDGGRRGAVAGGDGDTGDRSGELARRSAASQFAVTGRRSTDRLRHRRDVAFLVPTWWQAVRGDLLPDGWRWHWRRNRLGFDRADAVLVPTASHGAALRTVYGDLPSLRVIHNTARVPLYSVLPKEDLYLSAGRWWDTGKNGSVLDKAAANLTWPVVLAGQLEGPSGEHAHFQHARALGPLSPNHLVALMQRAALFAAPSVYEPFGLAVLEAALMGAALVLADIPSLHEIWHGAAVFVSPTDPAAWSQAIGGLADDPARRHDLTVLARSRAANFTPTRQKNEILAAYGAALASHAIRTARAA